MGRRIENNCVGCESCIGCGQRKQEVIFCDCCDTYADMWNPLYRVDGKELCMDCVKEHLISKICDDMDEERCGKCGYEAESLYQYDGEWLCENCLESTMERVDIDE